MNEDMKTSMKSMPTSEVEPIIIPEGEEPVPIPVNPQEATLVDVEGGTASGMAASSVMMGSYTLVALFENLPELKDDYFYEGWVVRTSPLSVISTGEIEYVAGKAQNLFSSDLDYSDHKLYVLTREPRDGDPAPADHVVEGMFMPLQQ